MNLPRRLLLRLTPSLRTQPAISRAAASFHLVATWSAAALALAGLRAAEPARDETAPSQLARELIGTWMMVEDRGTAVNTPEPARRYKSFDGKEWLITQKDPATNEVIYRNGGTYAIEWGDIMVTTNRNTSASTTLRYLVWIKGDILTQKGMGNPYSQAWKRVSSERPAKGPTEEVALRQAKTNSREITQTAWSWASSNYIGWGRYSDALRVLENVRSYLRRAGKTESPEFVALTINVGVVLTRGLGQSEQAAAAYNEADATCIRLYGQDSIERVEILNRLCELLANRKNFEEAVKAGREAVRIAAKHRGPSNPDTADALHYLALALAELPDNAETEAVLRRVLEIRQATEGPSAYWTALALHNLGVFYLQTKRLAEATKAIFEAQRTMQSQVSAQSPDGIAGQRCIIRVFLDSRNKEQAAARAEKLFGTELSLFQKSFPDLDESGRLSLKSRFEPGRWLCTIGEAQPIARVLLQTKAITLDQMLAHPVTLTNEDDPFAYLLKPENAAQGLLPYAPRPTEPKRSGSEMDRLSPLAQSLLLVKPTGTNPPKGPFSLYSITPEQVCASLPSNAVVIEFARYKHYTGWMNDEDRYGALVFRPDSTGTQSLQWVPLGAADRIDREVGSLLESATDALASGTLAARLRELHELIWAPVAKAIPAGTKNVYICPDGQLCFLPFSTLLDPQGAFLADRYLVMYLSTTRDLFRADAADKISTDRFAVFAAPSFGQHSAAKNDAPGFRFRDADARSLQDLQLADLPGARREASVVETLATERQFKPGVFTGEAASKLNVERLDRPRVVHFATHGFMLPPAVAGASSNPMDRSGLALAGAQATLTAMAKGQSLPPIGEDGLLTAREVAQLHWQGTWLVTLSACSTGRGEVRDGESVLGLRRGFLAAGVENLLLSLWKISDEETVGFMRDFYARALDSNDAATVRRSLW